MITQELLGEAGPADLNELLTLRHIERDQIEFHRPNDEGSRGWTRHPLTGSGR